MAAASRKPLSWGWIAVLFLVLVPAWKGIEPLLPRGPQPVSEQVRAQGRELFTHRWTERDPLTGGDGLGPVYNASSCVECHSQGGAGGGGPADKNVTVYSLAKPHPKGLPQSGVVHQMAISRAFQETLNQVHPSLPAQPSLPLKVLTDRSRPRSADLSITERNTPALFGDGQIDAISNDAIVTHQRELSTAARLVGFSRARDSQVRGRVARLADGRIGRFGWKLEFATLGEFVKAACANELGLSNPGRPQATPLGRPEYKANGVDLTDEQCGLMADFIQALPPPLETVPADPRLASEARAGKSLFRAIGCADCHVESLGTVKGLYSDLLLHDMGTDLEAQAGYGGPPSLAPIRDDKFEDSQQPSPGEWRTAPLWGVADSAPYLHDGRAATLERAIESHGGEATGVTGRYAALSVAEKQTILAFLMTLRAPAVDGVRSDSANLAAR